MVEGFELGAPMDDNEIYVAGIEIVIYLDAQGNNCYRIRHDPEAQVSTLVGIMEMAKFDLLSRNRQE